LTRRLLLALCPLGLLVPRAALADDVPVDLPRLVLDDGRVETAPPEAGLIRLQLHGEEQIRVVGLRSFPLDATTTVVQRYPAGTNVVSDSLGQNYFASHWLRLTPRLQLGPKLTIVAQADLTGLVAGQLAHDTYPDQTPRDTINGYDGYSNVQPRWLYAEWLTPVGLLRAGQQPSHWGMGLVANDGDHPTLFGDYRYGNIVEQVLFATKPLGEKSPCILAAFYEQGPDMLGVYGVYRHQTRDRSSEPAYFPYTDTINVGVLDLAGHFARRIPVPEEAAYVFGSFEAATEIGSTDEQRTVYQSAPGGPWTSLRTYGGAAALGVVLAESSGPKAANFDKRPDLFGHVVAQVEVGYASGDANPDGTEQKRFVFDPNHKVGLLLFDEVMRWQTARASAAAQDPKLSNGSRPQPGSQLLPSNGGVFGAQYVYPTAIVRPRRWLDLKLGAVIAQTTADYVDPYRLAVQGAYVNYTGGDPKRHDLGVELDGGFEVRVALDYGVRLQLGAQAGVLFPGGALADAAGNEMKMPWVAIGRAGLQF
jgi:hypothetical protein